jgi:uncharacterized protein YbjT (DUF2867 family)
LCFVGIVLAYIAIQGIGIAAVDVLAEHTARKRDYGLLTTDYGLPRVRSPSVTARLNWTARTGFHQRKGNRIHGRFIMKVVVIGGTGLIGSKVVDKLNQHGHEAIAAAPNTGVNTLTGEGLAEVLTGAQVVVDVANSPSFEDGPAWDFFTTATGNVLNAAESAGVSHIVALSVVGTERLLDSGYFRAKNAQEQLISEGTIPFSIVRATQFFEFVGRIADSATDGDTVRISSAPIQPMVADDVATAVARTAVGQPLGGILEVAGPDRYPLDDLVRARFRAQSDPRRVVTDPQSRYFGVVLDDHTLVPGPDATVFPTRFEDWLLDNALAPAR